MCNATRRDLHGSSSAILVVGVAVVEGKIGVVGLLHSQLGEE